MIRQPQQPPPSPLMQYLREIGALSKTGGQLSGVSPLSTLGGDLTSAANIYSGIKRGGVSGYGGAALSGAKLYDSATGTQASPLLGAAGSALGLYNNLKQGGVGGDAQAAVNAGQLYGTLGAEVGAPGAEAVGAYAGAAALPLALFLGQYELFNKQSQISPESMARAATEGVVTDPSTGKLTTSASLEPYNQRGEPWQPAGYNPQEIGQAQAQSDEALAKSYRTGQYFNPITGKEVAWNPNSDGPPQWQPNETGVPINVRPSGGNPYIHASAEGGSMKKRKKSALDEIYRGPSFSERRHFQDGGGTGYEMYAQYDASPPPSYDTMTPAQLRDQGQSGNSIASQYQSPPSSLDYYTPYGAGSQLNLINPTTGQPVGTGATSGDSGYAMNPDGTINTSSMGGIDPAALASLLQGGSSSVPNMPSASSQQLQNALANLNGTNGIAGLLTALGSIAPVAGAMIRPKTNTNAPTAAPGMTQGATSPKPSTFNRTQVAAPSNKPDGSPMNLQDWYTYGSRPEASFFNNNAAPLAQATGVSGQAKGGRQSALDSLGGDFGMPEFDSAVEHHVEGPGDGTSDDIPAQLSDGEYVMDAPTVSLLGNGSNKAGAARLDQLRENVRKHAAKPMSKGKQFMKAKAPEQYMGGKAKGKKE